MTDTERLAALLTNHQMPDGVEVTVALGELRSLMAAARAETPGLDVERLARAMEAAGWPIDPNEPDEIVAVAREYAALEERKPG